MVKSTLNIKVGFKGMLDAIFPEQKEGDVIARSIQPTKILRSFRDFLDFASGEHKVEKILETGDTIRTLMGFDQVEITKTADGLKTHYAKPEPVEPQPIIERGFGRGFKGMLDEAFRR